MAEYPRRAVRDALRRLGLSPGPGTGDGHERWVTDDGRAVKPVLRARMTPEAHLYPLGAQLEGIGVCSRKRFIDMVKGRA